MSGVFSSTSAFVLFPDYQDYVQFVVDVNEAELFGRTIYVNAAINQLIEPTNEEIDLSLSHVDMTTTIVVSGGKYWELTPLLSFCKYASSKFSKK